MTPLEADPPPEAARAAAPAMLAGGRAPLSAVELCSLAAVLLLAMVFRLHRLDSAPWGVSAPEAETVLAARAVVDSGIAAVPVGTAAAGAVAAPFVSVLGPHVLAARCASVVVGLLAVTATWLAGRVVLGPWGGIAAAGLLAASRWHVTFSRFGTPLVVTTLLAPLAVAAWHASGAPRAPWRVGPGRRAASIAGRALLAGLAVALGALAWAVVRTDQRARHAEPGGAALSNVTRTLGMLHAAGDRDPLDNLPGEPLLDGVSAGLAALGVLVCALRPRARGAALLLVLFAVGLVPGVLGPAARAPDAAATLGSAPAAALLAAVPLAVACGALARGGGVADRGAAACILVASLAAASVLSWRTYFGRQLVDPRVALAFGAVESRIAEVVRGEGPVDGVYVPAGTCCGPISAVVAGSRVAAKVYDPRTDPPLPVERRALAFVNGDDRAGLAHLRAAHPGATIERWSVPLAAGRARATDLFVARLPAPPPPQATPAPRTIEEEVKRALDAPLRVENGRVERTVVNGWLAQFRPRRGAAREGIVSSASWSWADAPVRPPATVTLRASLVVRERGLHVLVLASTPRASLHVDGRRVLEPGSGERRAGLDLDPGLHPVLIEVENVSGVGETRLSWSEPGGGAPELVPGDRVVAKR